MKTYRSRNNLVRIYLNDEELQTLHNLCEETTYSMSRVIRELIIKAGEEIGY